MEINYSEDSPVDPNLLSFVIRSTYRANVLKAIGHSIKMPKEIAEDAGIRLNHISTVLRDLKEHGLVVCLNPNNRKGRLYRLTDLGLLVLEILV